VDDDPAAGVDFLVVVPGVELEDAVLVHGPVPADAVVLDAVVEQELPDLGVVVAGPADGVDGVRDEAVSGGGHLGVPFGDRRAVGLGAAARWDVDGPAVTPDPSRAGWARPV